MATSAARSIPKETPTPHRFDPPQRARDSVIRLAVAVAALGYFVDAFDLWLFANLRVASLTALGLSPSEVTTVGASLINWQQSGLLLGGVIWGVLGDRRGRAWVMFGSIALYSIANILNGYISTIEEYRLLRFLAGIGLAGEIGSGITLVLEIMPAAKRGWGTTIVATCGVSGACFAAIVAQRFAWRDAYILGGVLGILLLFLRFWVHESGMFSQMRSAVVPMRRGSLKLLFEKRERALRFLACVCLGLPLYFTFGLFVSFAPEISQGLGIDQAIPVADVLFWSSISLAVGDLAAGASSQLIKSRKIPIGVMLAAAAVVDFSLAAGVASTSTAYITFVTIGGFFAGYWACLLTTAAEQFGTNLRATVATMLPNIVRASIIPITLAFTALKEVFTMQQSLLVVGAVVFALGGLSLWYLRESFGRELDFYEL